MPRVHVSAATGELTDVSGEWAALMRADAADLVGQMFVEFRLPEARVAAQAMYEAVSQYREVRSEALVRRPDGTTLAIEFRAARRDGEIEVSYRPLEKSVSFTTGPGSVERPPDADLLPSIELAGAHHAAVLAQELPAPCIWPSSWKPR